MTEATFCFVLIRGLLRESRHWGDFPQRLQQQYPGSLILTPDIPGNGHLNHLVSPNTIADFTDTLRQQVPDNYTVKLIAISMGGMIAIDWMHRYPKEVNAAVLINTSLRNISPFYKRLHWQSYPKIIKLLLSKPPVRELLILALTSNKHRYNAELIRHWQCLGQENPVTLKSAVNQLRASATFSMQGVPLHPLLIISSSADRLVDYRCSLKLQQLWHKDYLQHDSAGHDLPLDEPKWLISEMSRWFDCH